MNVKISAARTEKIRRHNEKANMVTPIFYVGDFVVVRQAQDSGHKLSFILVGPRRIVNSVSSVVYDVENVVTGQVARVHSARLQLYRTSLDDVGVS